MSKMIHEPTLTFEFRDAAMRMVAATAHFKAAGELPAWARIELASWRAADARELRSLTRAGPPQSAIP